MSETLENVLRKSLDEVDRIQRRQVVGAAIFLILFLIQAYGVGHSLYLRTVAGVREPSSLQESMSFGLSFMVFTVAFCTFGITFFISRMTKKILKAIELLAKP